MVRLLKTVVYMYILHPAFLTVDIPRLIFRADICKERVKREMTGCLDIPLRHSELRLLA